MKRLLLVLSCVISTHAFASISVKDDNGNLVVLEQPAKRIVTLAPHVTELVFAAGGGDKIVGTVKYSDYPIAARSIPRIGDNRQVDMERMIALKPDLLVVWMHNSSARQLEPLRKLGIPLFYSEPHKMEDIAGTLERLGQLFGTEKQAQQSAIEFRQKIGLLEKQYSNRSTVPVFYQVWNNPLYTLNNRHIVTDLIQACGGKNIFATLPMAAPIVTIEAVLLENPEVVLSGKSSNKPTGGLEIWSQTPTLLAVKRGNLFTIDADLLDRPGPRIVDGAAALCAKLEQARSKRTVQQ